MEKEHVLTHNADFAWAMGLVRAADQAEMLVPLGKRDLSSISHLSDLCDAVAEHAQSIGRGSRFVSAALIFHDNPCVVDPLPGEIVELKPADEMRATVCDLTLPPNPEAKYYVLFEPPAASKRPWTEPENGPTQRFLRGVRGLHTTITLPKDIRQLAQQVHDMQLPHVSVEPDVAEHVQELAQAPWLSANEPVAWELSDALRRLFSSPLVAETEDTLHSLLDDTLGRVCSKAYGIRKRNRANSYRFGRSDVTVEVRVNAQAVVVFLGEEEHCSNYCRRHPEHDPVQELLRKTPWDEWPDFFHDLPYIFCFFVIAGESSADLQFGCLELSSRTLQPLEHASFDLMTETGRVAAFEFMLKLVPFIEHAAVRASTAEASLAWQSLDRPSGASLSTGVFHGESRVQKRWTPPTEKAATDLLARLRKLQVELSAIQQDEDRFFAAVCDVGSARDVVYALFRRLKLENCDSDSVLVAIGQVIEAVVQLHAREIIHRDIRWPNVMFSQATSRFVLIDFDEYAVLDSDGCAPGVSRLDPSTHAPNIHERHGKEVDVWSIGYMMQDQCANQDRRLRELGEAIMAQYQQLSIADVQQQFDTVAAQLSGIAQGNAHH